MADVIEEGQVLGLAAAGDVVAAEVVTVPGSELLASLVAPRAYMQFLAC